MLVATVFSSRHRRTKHGHFRKILGLSTCMFVLQFTPGFGFRCTRTTLPGSKTEMFFFDNQQSGKTWVFLAACRACGFLCFLSPEANFLCFPVADPAFSFLPVPPGAVTENCRNKVGWSYFRILWHFEIRSSRWGVGTFGTALQNKACGRQPHQVRW